MSGKAGRSGRKSKAEELGLQELLDTCWPLADRGTAIKKLAALSNRGNLQALQILMAYTYGKPKERHEITGADGGPVIVKGYISISPDDWDIQPAPVAD
jgi:hypothetical protein